MKKISDTRSDTDVFSGLHFGSQASQVIDFKPVNFFAGVTQWQSATFPRLTFNKKNHFQESSSARLNLSKSFVCNYYFEKTTFFCKVFFLRFFAEISDTDSDTTLTKGKSQLSHTVLSRLGKRLMRAVGALNPSGFWSWGTPAASWQIQAKPTCLTDYGACESSTKARAECSCLQKQAARATAIILTRDNLNGLIGVCW